MDQEKEVPVNDALRNKKEYDLLDLQKVMSVLLSGEGCPWDKAQTHESLAKYLIEECYEVLDAIEQKDDDGLLEELGDVLFQLIFHTALSERRGGFNFSDVINGVTKKMITRHSHIFGGDQEVSTPEEVLKIWEENKQKEKGYTSVKEKLGQIPRQLPALIRAEKVQEKAFKNMSEEQSLSHFILKAQEGLKSLENADINSKEYNHAEYGNLLWNLVAISRHLQINAEFSLTNATETFINRFEYIEDISDK